VKVLGHEGTTRTERPDSVNDLLVIVMIKRRGFFGLLAGAVATVFGAKVVQPTQAWAESAEEEFGIVRWMPDVYAHGGDVVVCENGHAICAFADTVRVGDMFDSRHLILWTQPEPAIGDIEAPCHVCGARWFKGSYFHFQDGWRIGGRSYATVTDDTRNFAPLG
jgi:hypothetical protein